VKHSKPLLTLTTGTNISTGQKKNYSVNLKNYNLKLRLETMMTERKTAYNTGLAKVAVQCSADTFVVKQTLVLRINICGENRHLRQALNRYEPFYRT
jgi:hypothetical protein